MTTKKFIHEGIEYEFQGKYENGFYHVAAFHNGRLCGDVEPIRADVAGDITAYHAQSGIDTAFQLLESEIVKGIIKAPDSN